MKIIIIVTDKTDLGDSGDSGERPPGGLVALCTGFEIISLVVYFFHRP